MLKHSPPQKVSADVRFSDSGKKGKDAKRMSNSLVGPVLSRENNEPNDKAQSTVQMGARFLQRQVH